MSLCVERTEESTRSLEIGVTSICESTDMSPEQKLHALLTTQLSLQLFWGKQVEFHVSSQMKS